LTPPAALAYGQTFTATVKGGAAGARVKDTAGNALATSYVWSFTTEPAPPPILLIGSTANPFSTYAGEILRAEGFSFSTLDISLVSPGILAFFDVVVLGETALTPTQVTTLTNWVQGGGNLIALRPDKQLASLLGLADAGATLTNGYLLIDTASGPGAGLVGETIQFHGPADRYTLNGATAVATLYSSATAATSSPAVSLRSVGTSGGQAAAFTYDLARSVVYTRQGNPAWAGQERDGVLPIRPDDLFFGAKVGDVQPDWVNTAKLAIPQADEQQRLLANLVVSMARDRKPLPRFWYFPRDEKAAIVMTGDDHANGGTAGRFDQYIAASPPGCSVVNWECARSTAYIYANSPLTNAQAQSYVSQGFEVAQHIYITSPIGCGDWTAATLDSLYYAPQRSSFAASYPGVPPPVTNRTHCVTWSDWATQPKVERTYSIRLDTNYYHYPGSWIGSKPGFMTGSGMVMRFADLDGTAIDVYQAHTNMDDEASQPYPATVDALLDKALGPEGYYGFFVANMHADQVSSPGSDAIVASAQARGVPIISAKQLLDWIDGRNGSRFETFTWSGNTLGFSIAVATGANGLQAMLPVQGPNGRLQSISRNGTPAAFAIQTIKGVEYAVFPAAGGTYSATYPG
jgi:hypothetical protein